MENTQSKIKPIKTGKYFGTTYCFGCIDYMKTFSPQEVKMTNTVLREKSLKNKLIADVIKIR